MKSFDNTPYEFDYFIDENVLRLEEVKDIKDNIKYT